MAAGQGDRWPALGPLERALVLGARVRLDGAAERELRALLDGGIDSDALAAAAQRHDVVALVCRHLPEAPPDAAGSEVLRGLRAEVHRSAAQSLALAAELVDVLAALERAGVAALAIKGPVAAALCYGDLGLRSFSDLDLLVAPEDVAAAWACLAARGYAPRFALAPAWRERLLRSDSQLLFRHADGARLVDLHWSLLPRGYSFTPDGEGLFAARRMVPVGAASVPTLGLEATLLFLLLHGAKHDWQSLGWLCDVAELLRREPSLDWDAVVGWSSRGGRRRLVDIGLLLAHRLLDAPVPARLLERGRADRAVARLAETLARRLFGPASTTRPSIFSLDYLLAMEQPRDRVRFLHDVVLRPTPLEWEAVPLPAALAPLHYLVRPARLLWKHAVSRDR